MDAAAFLISLKLATAVSAFLLLAGVPLAWWMTRVDRAWAPFLEAVFTLPMTLPPTVLGFYLLVAFSPRSPLGAWVEGYLGFPLVFSFQGLVLAGTISGMPFMFTNLIAGIRAVPWRLVEASRVLGKGDLETLLRIVLPNMKGAVIVAVVLTFAHAIGEFGVVLLVGGSIPGATKTASVALFEKVEMLDWGSAHRMALLLLLGSYFAMLAVHLVGRRGRAGRP